MSGLLAGKVWQSDLASHLKPLAAALADIANDDGTSIYPSVAYVAWLLGKGRRSVQVGLAELKQLQIIEAIGSDKGGRGQPTEYRMLESNLPKRIAWKDLRKGAENARFTEPKGAESDTKGRGSEHQRVHFSTERAHSDSSDPSVDTSREPSEEPLPFASPEFTDAFSDYEQARKENRHRITPTIRRALCKKMREWGEERSIAALIHSTGYTGLFEPHRNSNGNGQQVKTASDRRVDQLKSNLEFLRSNGRANHS